MPTLSRGRLAHVGHSGNKYHSSAPAADCQGTRVGITMATAHADGPTYIQQD